MNACITTETLYISQWLRIYIFETDFKVNLSAGMVKYADYAFAEWLIAINYCPGYDIKPSEGEASVVEFLEIWSTSSLLLPPGLF